MNFLTKLTAFFFLGWLVAAVAFGADLTINGAPCGQLNRRALARQPAWVISGCPKLAEVVVESSTYYSRAGATPLYVDGEFGGSLSQLAWLIRGSVTPIGALVCKVVMATPAPSATPAPIRWYGPLPVVLRGTTGLTRDNPIGVVKKLPRDLARLDCERLADPVLEPWSLASPTPTASFTPTRAPATP